MSLTVGHPHLHLPEAGSTNELARWLAERGAPSGTTVSADRQTAGRGRQGRTWSSPAGAIAQSFVIRSPTCDPALLPLAAAVATAELCGSGSRIKWPNDIWLMPGRKVAGILVETRQPADWYVIGIGVNAAVTVDDLGPDATGRSATLGLDRAALPAYGRRLSAELGRALALDRDSLLAAWRTRDGLLGRTIEWSEGSGVAAGIDDEGRLLVSVDGVTDPVRLVAGEVHLTAVG